MDLNVSVEMGRELLTQHGLDNWNIGLDRASVDEANASAGDRVERRTFVHPSVGTYLR